VSDINHAAAALHRSRKFHTTKLHDNRELRKPKYGQLSTESPSHSRHVTQRVFTLPEQTPYVARAPAQQKQNPGGFVSALAEQLQMNQKQSS